jgi:cytochrome c peroxidase
MHVLLKPTMRILRLSVAVGLSLCVAVPVLAGQPTGEPDVEALEKLGKRVFFDNISSPANRQACASCHSPETGWTAPSSRNNLWRVVVPGADPRTSGGRKPPGFSYASRSAKFGDADPARGGCIEGVSPVRCKGGLFWDGRATGAAIGLEVFKGNTILQAAYEPYLGPMADQALGPFANDVEQNVPDGHDNGLPGAQAVCMHVKKSKYAWLYKRAWGEPIECKVAPDLAFKRIAVAISAWEHSPDVDSYSSKFDRALARDGDDTPGQFPLARFTRQENLGRDLFFGVVSELNPEGKNAKCARCHNSEGAAADGSQPFQTFSDNSFHHLGVPPNHDISNFDAANPDYGLAHHLMPGTPSVSTAAGAFRTPTLRNVDKRPYKSFVKAYMHNGYFKSLEEVVHFYNTARVKLDPVRCPPGTRSRQAMARGCWPEAEVNNGRLSSGVIPDLLGDLGLTAAEEAALVAFLKTLTDEETVVPPKPLH